MDNKKDELYHYYGGMSSVNELYHYGVPGMKWGQRRASAKLNKITKRAKKRGWSDDATEVEKIKTKKVKQMSNDDLKKAKKRGELERDYKNLNPNAIKKGLAIAGTTAAALGTMATLYKYGKPIMNKGKKVAGSVLSKVKNQSHTGMWAKGFSGNFH